MDPVPSPALAAALARQRGRDLLGPDPIDDLRAHSHGFARAVGPDPARAVDLGSGGGVPGLVLAAECWPSTGLTLLDASQRRCTYLELEVAELGLDDRVEVRWGRAEELGRQADLRGRCDAVVARSFGPPSVTAECAAPLLRVEGVLVVSEPPDAAPGRWNAEGLAALGLVHEATEQVAGLSYARFRQVTECPDRFPRRPGLPARRPLF